MQDAQVRALGWEDTGERNGYPLQYSRLENSTDRRAWQATAHGIQEELDTTQQLTLSLS